MKMDIKSRQYRTVEMTRHKNRREQRRLEHSISSKHGLLANHKQELQAMKRETARVQRELHAIQRGYPYSRRREPGDYGRPSRPAPAGSESESNIATAISDPPLETSWGLTKDATTSPRRSKPIRRDQTASKDQDDIVDGVSSRTAKQSSNVKNTNSIRNKGISKNNNSYSKRSNYISMNSDDLTSKSPTKRLYDDLSSDEPVLVTMSTKDNESNVRETTNDHTEQEQKTPRRSSKFSDQPISAINISEAKENVAKRLLSSNHKDNEISTETVSSTPRYSAPPTDFQGQGPIDPLPQFPPEEEEQVDAISRKASTTNRPPIQSIKNKSQKKAFEEMMENLTFDAETYNPDGNLRTLHTMPSFENRMEQAKKARYVRHRERPEFEKELSVSQIFEGMKPSVANVTE